MEERKRERKGRERDDDDEVCVPMYLRIIY